VRISELSRQTGVPVPTIKFYLREGLLPAGTPTGRNQATYDAEHERRILIIRTLISFAHFDLASARSLLAAIYDDQLSLPDVYEVADRARFPGDSALDQAGVIEQARADVDDFIGRQGWTTSADAPGRNRLAQVVAALRQLGCQHAMDLFIPYAEAADRLADEELGLIPVDAEADDRAAAVTRTILLDVAIAAMRGIAHEHHVVRRFR